MRPACEDDLDGLVAIEREANPSSPWTREALAGELAKPFSQFWIITDDSTDTEIFGFIIFNLAGETAHIVEIAIATDSRRQGLGSALLRAVVRYVLKVGKHALFLEVRKSNEAAIKFYQELGFVVVRKREQFYSNGEDAYEMRFALKATNPDHLDE